MAMTLQQMLDDARQKLHLLETGRLSVEVMADGYMVKYTRATVPQLKSYIGELEAKIAGKRQRGAIVPIW
jgi:BMFP domain-containing protein YqiC